MTVDKTPKQEIAENSTGIQAQGNITIDNSGIKSEVLLPTLIGLSRDVGEVKIILHEVREQQRTENLKSHLEHLKTEIKAQEEESFPQESTSNVRKTMLIEEWMHEVSNIDPSEEILAQIWREWMIELGKGRDTTELAHLMEIMKKLTPAHGKLLLSIASSKTKSSGMIPWREKKSSFELAYLKELEELGIVSKMRTSLPFMAGLASIISIFATTYLLSRNTTSVAGNTFILGATGYGVAFVYGIFAIILYNNPSYIRYGLTEIGEQLISFSKSDNLFNESID